MNPLPALLAPLLLLPVAAATDVLPTPPAPVEAAEANAELAPETPELADALGSDGLGGLAAFRTIAQAFEAQAAQQVRIEQRVIIRIAPSMPAAPAIAPRGFDPRRSMLADLPQREVGPHFEERSMGKCLPLSGIAGVQYGGSHNLVLFMRDQRIVSAALEKACNAADFYSGFYVERTADGMLCQSRDKLKSRTGTTCGVAKLRQLIEVDD